MTVTKTVGPQIFYFVAFTFLVYFLYTYNKVLYDARRNDAITTKIPTDTQIADIGIPEEDEYLNSNEEYFDANSSSTATLDIEYHEEPSIDSNTFFDKTSAESLIPEIDEGDPKPEPSRSANQIFFMETTNVFGGPLHLNPREACAVESAARFHPDRDVYVIFTGPTSVVSGNQTQMVDVLTNNYPNIHYRSITFDKFSTGTILDGFTKYKESKFPSSHMSDILRFLVTWKYGGLFCDLDVMFLNSVDGFSDNFVVKSGIPNIIMTGTFQISATGIGHNLMEKCLNALKEKFQPNTFAGNDMYIMTGAMNEICQTNKTVQMNSNTCQGLRVVDTNVFLPILNYKVYGANNRKTANRYERFLNSHKRIRTVHVYSHLLNKVEIKRDSKCLYLRLAKKYCPRVYESFGDNFSPY